MGQYKVPQNVEAEDKILGPLTFKQFVYAMIGMGWGVVCFALFHALPAVMILVGGPVVMLFLLLAFYTRDGQNFEQLLIAMVGFFANSRRRLWRKEAIIESFHIEPHKVVAEQSQRNPAEVRSQLDHLASLIDSRGWNQEADPTLTIMPATPSDRLIAPTTAPEPMTAETKPSEDILDLQHSPLAQNLASLIQDAAADVREEAIEQMKARQTAARRAVAAPPSVSGVTTPSTGDILELATKRDDLTVSQLAATATRIAPLPEGQAVELHNNGSAATGQQQ